MDRGSSEDRALAAKPARFSRGRRLLRHADFDAVYRQGKRHFAACMTVFYLRRPPGMGMRVGFTVARGLGGAVQRNRMKRRLREAVRLNRVIEAPVDVVINPKATLLKVDFLQVQNQIARAFDVIEKDMGGAKARP